MNAMTEANLKSAFGGESMAHMRYLHWAELAEKEGFPGVARLFRAVARAEWIHAGNHLRVLKDRVGDAAVTAGGGFGYQSTSQALQGGIDGETFEIEQMYPVYKQVAEFQGETAAVRSFHYALETEKVHRALYEEAKAAVDQGKDISFGTLHVCPVCGYTVKGDAPEHCPVCGAGADRFEAHQV
ncbi:rubrerythrin family protein [Deferrisoma camini]|uniref:rubrerythrin family protein n=1 Tax=Deferrisoma camini TaxID=1035120 RepID=UPI00046D3528|nr:rubrerythrin family protein [Deferrisoma camini]